MSKLDIRLDREVCIGAENCLRFAPKTFATDAESKVILQAGERDSDETIRVAVSSCPVGALALAEDVGEA